MSEKRVLEGFRPGELDHVSFFAADKTGFFVGELNEEPISCVSIVKHSDNFAFIGHFLVYQEYREGGYGLKTWKKALKMASLEDDCNIGIDSLAHTEHIYQKSGFKRAWFVKRVDFVAYEAASTLAVTQSISTAKILPVSDIHFHDIVDYDTHIYNSSSRREFLEKWIFAPNSYSFVALGSEGTVVGYAVVRTTLRREEGWKVGPLFSDNSEVARDLYRAVFERVASEEKSAVVCADVPYGEIIDESALQIANELSGTLALSCIRMYTNGVPPNMLLQKIFSHTALEIY